MTPATSPHLRDTRRRTACTLLLAAGSLVPVQLAWSQEAKPAEAPPVAAPQSPEPLADADVKKVAPPADTFDTLGRRIKATEPAILAFKSAAVSELIPFIVESTGKVVMPQQDVLARRVTIVSDRLVPRDQALDLVFLALQQVGVGVVETPTLILLRDQAEIDRQNVPVITPDQSTLERQDQGTVAQKVFGLRAGNATTIGEIVKGNLPDYAKLVVDADSNQIIITAPVALLQRMERLIASLDRPSAAGLVSETFHLKYADADQVAANIRELFGDASNRTTTGTQPGIGGGGGGQNNPFRQFLGGQGGGGGGAAPAFGQPAGGGGGGNQAGARNASASTGALGNIRVTSNRQQNAVTVLGEPAIVDKIRKQVNDQWDVAVPQEAVVPRVFELKHADPIKVRDTLEGLFGVSAARSVGGLSQGVGRLAGQFSFQAIPEAQQIVVVAKSPDNLDIIERIIQDLDQPRTTGMPRVVDLKHAIAEDLAEQVNALLAQEGTLAAVRRVSNDLSSSASAGLSPFSSTSVTPTGDGGFSQSTTTQPQSLQFWWQRARPPTDSTGASTLVSKIRVVPVQRSNSLMVLAPAEFADAVISLINQLDRPGRQVLISAIIAELSNEDALALGLRFSNTAITPTNPDNAIGFNPGAVIPGGPTAANQVLGGVKNDILPGLFDTSVLNVGVNINALLQALDQKTKVTVLSEPRIYTGDNIEATFFDGQDIPFITNSEVNSQGNLTQSFDYRAVGIQLRARPRITPERDVDIKINVQLSSIVPGQTLFGGFVVDRRETTTQLIVKDGQTVVISGIMRTEDSDIKRKVPILGDLPILDLIFSSVEKTKTTTELVAFITPIVVENPTDADRVNETERQRLDQLREKLAPAAPK
ncbi:MAG: secretin N-terminal domain-containing protein [Phycisphaerales bacterium]